MKKSDQKPSNTTIHIALSDYFDWSSAEQFLSQKKLSNPVKASEFFMSECLQDKHQRIGNTRELSTALHTIDPDIYYMPEFWAVCLQNYGQNRYDSSNFSYVLDTLLRQTETRDIKKLLSAVVQGGSFLLSEEPVHNNYTLPSLTSIKNNFSIKNIQLLTHLNELLESAFLSVFQKSHSKDVSNPTNTLLNPWNNSDQIRQEIKIIVAETQRVKALDDDDHRPYYHSKQLDLTPYGLNSAEKIIDFLEFASPLVSDNNEFPSFSYFHKFYQLNHHTSNFKLNDKNIGATLDISPRNYNFQENLNEIFLNLDFYTHPDHFKNRSDMPRNQVMLEVFFYLFRKSDTYRPPDEMVQNFFSQEVTKQHCFDIFQKSWPNDDSQMRQSHIQKLLTMHQQKTLNVLNSDDFWSLLITSDPVKKNDSSNQLTPHLPDISVSNIRANTLSYFRQYFEPEKFQSFFNPSEQPLASSPIIHATAGFLPSSPNKNYENNESHAKRLKALCELAMDEKMGYLLDLKHWSQEQQNCFLRSLCINDLPTLESYLKKLPHEWHIEPLEIFKKFSNSVLSIESNLKDFYQHPHYREVLKNGDLIEEALKTKNRWAADLFLFCAKKYKSIAQDPILNRLFLDTLASEYGRDYKISEYVENRRTLYHDSAYLPSLCQQLPRLYKYIKLELWQNPEVCLSLLQNFDKNELDNPYHIEKSLDLLKNSVPHSIKHLIDFLSSTYENTPFDMRENFKISEQYQLMLDQAQHKDKHHKMK